MHVVVRTVGSEIVRRSIVQIHRVGRAARIRSATLQAVRTKTSTSAIGTAKNGLLSRCAVVDVCTRRLLLDRWRGATTVTVVCTTALRNIRKELAAG
jgi:hypothetical protein